MTVLPSSLSRWCSWCLSLTLLFCPFPLARLYFCRKVGASYSQPLGAHRPVGIVIKDIKGFELATSGVVLWPKFRLGMKYSYRMCKIIVRSASLKQFMKAEAISSNRHCSTALSEYPHCNVLMHGRRCQCNLSTGIVVSLYFVVWYYCTYTLPSVLIHVLSLVVAVQSATPQMCISGQPLKCLSVASQMLECCSESLRHRICYIVGIDHTFTHARWFCLALGSVPCHYLAKWNLRATWIVGVRCDFQPHRKKTVFAI